MAGLAARVLGRPRFTLIWVLALTALPAWGLWRLEVRTDGAAVYPGNDPAIERTLRDRRLFHEIDQVIVLATARPGSLSLASPRGLRYIRRLHRSLQEFAGGRRHRLRSLASLPDPRPGSPLLTMKAILDEVPDEAGAHNALIRRIRRSPLAQGLFLSADGQAAALYVPLPRHRNRVEYLDSLDEWADRHRNADFDLRLTGPVVAEVRLGEAVLNDLFRLVPVMVAVMAVLLLAALRSAGGVIAPLAEVLLVLLWTLGAMGLSGVPVTLVTTVLPVLLMTVAVTDEIHLLDRFRHHLRNGRSGAGGRRNAMRKALHDIARPLILTSLTTSIAFLSFLSASMAPVRHFGLFASLGVLLAMLLSFTLVPALALLLPRNWFREFGAGADRGVPAHEAWLIRRRGSAALLGLFLVLAALPGFSRLSVQDSWFDNFDPGSDLVTADRAYNSRFWGSYRLDVVLSSPAPEFFHARAGLLLLERLESAALEGPHVGGVLSPLRFFEMGAELLEMERPAASLPQPALDSLAVQLSRIAPRIDLDHYLRAGGASARLRLFVNSPDYQRGRALERYLESVLPGLLRGSSVSYHFSGDLPAAGAVVDAIVGNMLASAAWTLAGVAVLLAAILGRVRRAAVTVAPMLAGGCLLVGAMGYAGIPLGIATSMFIALTIGVAVDYALHFSHTYGRLRRSGLAGVPALERTLRHTGRAIRWNGALLSLGLLVLSTSLLKPNRSLGLLLAAAMALCYVATLVFLPWLLEKSPWKQPTKQAFLASHRHGSAYR